MWKIFQNNTALTAEDLNDVIVEQAVITFADATERNNAIPSPNPGMHCHLLSTKRTYYYDATNGWIELLPGQVSGLTARSILVCTSTTRPSHAAGRHIYETDTKVIRVSDGSAWTQVSPEPAKAMIAYRNVSTSGFPEGSWTAFSSDTNWVENDPSGMRGTGATFVAPLTGWYNIGGSISFAPNATGSRGFRLMPSSNTDLGRGNGQPGYLGMQPASAGTNSSMINGSITCAVTAGQSVQLEAYQNSGGTITVDNVTMHATYLGP